MLNQKMTGAIVAGATGITMAIMIASMIIVASSRQTMATPDIAKKTGQPCTKCHTSPPALNDYGKKYKK